MAMAASGRGEGMLVLCRANQIRSPLAAALIRRRLAMLGRRDLKVVSAGFEVVAGATTGSDVIQIGLERDVDLTTHRPRPFTAKSLAGAALVVTMTESQRSNAERLHRAATPYTFTLAELVRLLGASDEPPVVAWKDLARRAHAARPYVPPALHAEDVPDPIGRTLHQHRVVADMLVDLTEELVSHVAERATQRPV